MNIATMKTWFELLQDKNGSAYYTDSEISLFLNRAQLEFVNELLPENKLLPNVESSQDTTNQVAPLIYELPYQIMNSSGVITKSTISSALTNLNATAVLWRPLSIGLELGKIKTPVKFLRHNDRWEFEPNVFKRPSLKYPKIRETYNSYIITPANINARIYFTVLKYPLEVSITNSVSSELPESTHNRIVAIALEYAGVGSRDAMLTQLLSMQQQNAK